MKDLVQAAKTVKQTLAQDNPRTKEGLEVRFTQEFERIEALKPTAKTKRDQEIQGAIISAAKQRLENYTHKKNKEGIDYRDLTVELTHARYNASLLDLDARTMKYAAEHKIDLTEAVSQSREYKKRLKAFLTACAHKDATKLDKALVSLQAHMKAKRPEAMMVSEVQKVMNHATPTQANYFKRFAHLLGVVTASRSNQVPMEVHLENEITKDFLSL